jgi:ferredoxin
VRILVDVEKCTGHARCAAAAPRFYELDDEGFNKFRHEREVVVPVGMEHEARAGCEACPERAITVIEA